MNCPAGFVRVVASSDMPCLISPVTPWFGLARGDDPAARELHGASLSVDASVFNRSERWSCRPEYVV